MARLTKIYTRTGDDGSTRLGSGEKVPKDDPRVASYGEVDELNSLIGVALAAGLEEEVAALLGRVQSELLNLGGLLCLLGEEPLPAKYASLITGEHVKALEQACDRFNAGLGALENFILPGGSPQAAALHVARAVCRRAERRIVGLARERPVPPPVVHYLNRLSDLLFILARYENHRLGREDVPWDTTV